MILIRINWRNLDIDKSTKQLFIDVDEWKRIKAKKREARWALIRQ